MNTHRMVMMTGLFTAVVLATAAAMALSSEPMGLPGMEAGELLRCMDQSSATVRTGRLLVRFEIANPKVQPPSITTIEYELAFDGVRVREEERAHWVYPGGQAEEGSSEVLTVFDGERVLQVRPPDLSSARVAAPADLRELERYVGLGAADALIKWPLRAAVQHQDAIGSYVQTWCDEPLQVAGQQRVGELSCYLIEVPPAVRDGISHLKQYLWVAPDKGCAVAKYQFNTPDGRVVNEVQEWMEPLPGFHLPKVATRTGYVQEKGGGEKIAIVGRSEVLSAQFNIALPDSLFHVDLPKDATVTPFDAEPLLAGRGG